MNTLTNDAFYAVMQNMDMDELAQFCKSTKHINNLCQSEHFWREYVLGNNFMMVKPGGTGFKLKQKDCTWKELFGYTHKLKHRMQQGTHTQFIDFLIKNNKLDVLRPYFKLDGSVLKVYGLFEMIVIAGLKYNVPEILDKYHNDIEFRTMLTHLSVESYDYLQNHFNHHVLLNGLISYNNLPVVKHIIRKHKDATMILLSVAVTSCNVDVLDYLLSLNPMIDNNTINRMYGRALLPLYDVCMNKQKIDEMITYLLDHCYYNGDNCILYLIKTQNITLLKEINPPKKQEYIIYAQNYPLAYQYFMQ